MAYSSFTLNDVENKLGIAVKVESGVFSSIEAKEIPEL